MADSKTDVELPEKVVDLSGSWKSCKQEGLDEFLKLMNVSWPIRKVAQIGKVYTEIKQVNVSNSSISKKFQTK